MCSHSASPFASFPSPPLFPPPPRYSALSERAEGPAHLHTARAGTGCINNVADLESVELRRGTDGVRAHGVKRQPVANRQSARQLRDRADTVNGVAGRTPHTARAGRNRRRDVERAIQGQNVGLRCLMIEHDAVERAVHAVVHVV